MNPFNSKEIVEIGVGNKGAIIISGTNSLTEHFSECSKTDWMLFNSSNDANLKKILSLKEYEINEYAKLMSDKINQSTRLAASIKKIYSNLYTQYFHIAHPSIVKFAEKYEYIRCYYNLIGNYIVLDY